MGNESTGVRVQSQMVEAVWWTFEVIGFRNYLEENL